MFRRLLNMATRTRKDSSTPLMSEIFTKVNNAKTKDKKIQVLRDYDNQGLRMVVKASFDPDIIWVLPAEDPPFIPNDSPAGEQHTYLISEAKKLYRFVKGGHDDLNQLKRESLFISLLESLQEEEAIVLLRAKNKELHKHYKGLSKEVVKEAFGWNDNYMLKDV